MNEPRKIPERIDKKTIERIFKEYYHALCLYAKGIVGCMETAEDMVSELFAKLWNNREKIQITETWRAYLYKGVTNNCYKYQEHNKVVRKHSEEFQTPNDSDDWLRTHDNDNPLNMMIAQERENEVEKAIDTLPKQCKEVFLLRREGKSYQEIADDLGISTDAVGVQINRAIAKIRQSLENK